MKITTTIFVSLFIAFGAYLTSDLDTNTNTQLNTPTLQNGNSNKGKTKSAAFLPKKKIKVPKNG